MIIYNTIALLDIKEVFQDYRKTSLLLSFCMCDWKCWKNKQKDNICHNSELANKKPVEVSIDKIINTYKNNDLVEAIIFGGFEPFLQFDEMLLFIKEFRKQSEDEIIIYTGYYICEIGKQIEKLKKYNNIIVKFGRYLENDIGTYDEVLGIKLASSNQYAVKIS